MKAGAASNGLYEGKKKDSVVILQVLGSFLIYMASGMNTGGIDRGSSTISKSDNSECAQLLS